MKLFKKIKIVERLKEFIEKTVKEIKEETLEAKIIISVICIALLIIVPIVTFGIIHGLKKQDEIKEIAKQLGVNPADLVGLFWQSHKNDGYCFKRKNSNDNYSGFQSKGVLVLERTRNLILFWEFTGHAFLSSNPIVSIETPTTDRVILIKGKKDPLPSAIQTSNIGSGPPDPSIILKLESDDVHPHIVHLRLDNIEFAHAIFSGRRSFNYKYQSIKPLTVTLLLL